MPAPGQVLQDFQRSGVSPLQVIYEEHDGASLGNRLAEAGDSLKQAQPGFCLISDQRLGQIGNLVGEFG